MREGLWLPDGTLDSAKLKLLAYPYPQAVAGTLVNFTYVDWAWWFSFCVSFPPIGSTLNTTRFDWASTTATFSFVADVTVAGPTVVFADAELFFNGAAPRITAFPPGFVTAAAGPGPNQWSLRFAPAVHTGDLITVVVAPA